MLDDQCVKCISKHPTIEQNLCRRGAAKIKASKAVLSPINTNLPRQATPLTRSCLNCVPSQEREGRRGSLQQLIAAARLPNSGICEIAVNASFVHGGRRPRSSAPWSSKWPARIARPWRCLTGLGEPPGTRTVAGMACTAARLVEVLRRLRNGVLEQSASSMCM